MRKKPKQKETVERPRYRPKFKAHFWRHTGNKIWGKICNGKEKYKKVKNGKHDSVHLNILFFQKN